MCSLNSKFTKIIHEEISYSLEFLRCVLWAITFLSNLCWGNSHLQINDRFMLWIFLLLRQTFLCKIMQYRLKCQQKSQHKKLSQLTMRFFLILEDRSQQPSPAKLVLKDRYMQQLIPTIDLFILFDPSVAILYCSM